MQEIIRTVMICFFGIIVVSMIFDALEAIIKAIGWSGVILLVIVTIVLLAPLKEEGMKKNDVVQFIETHKWCGSLGIVTEVKKLSDGKYRYQIGVPIPRNDGSVPDTAFIFDDGSGIERVGNAILTLSEKED